MPPSPEVLPLATFSLPLRGTMQFQILLADMHRIASLKSKMELTHFAAAG
jgi:hypothetical protein